jgi:hypothetical protein
MHTDVIEMTSSRSTFHGDAHVRNVLVYEDHAHPYHRHITGEAGESNWLISERRALLHQKSIANVTGKWLMTQSNAFSNSNAAKDGQLGAIGRQISTPHIIVGG